MDFQAPFVVIPEWELKCGFDPSTVVVREEPAWITIDASDIPSPTGFPRAEDVLKKNAPFNVGSLPLRDPDIFVSGQIHGHLDEWKIILDLNGDEVKALVLDWLENGVDINKFFRHFKGNFKGRSFDADIPPKQYFQNSARCEKYADFISNELHERISSGCLKVLGRVGHCKPPRVIMPLTVEPTKPRLCHDERYLNLWIRELPFKLETLKDVHRLVKKNGLMITFDDKSGYDHVRLNDSSYTFFGIQFGGFFMVYSSLPFGFKGSAFIYQTVGMCVTSYLRSLNIQNSLYIDDRFAVSNPHFEGCADEVSPECLSYVVLQIVTRLGYTLSLRKCSLEPSMCKRYLGFLVDSEREAYILPEDKRLKFSDLRELILSLEKVDLKTLQRFSGKCISMSLAVPGCKLFCREVNAAISYCIKNSKCVEVTSDLREELIYWRFIDSWSGCSPWRPEFHNTLEIYTDSSLFRYGAQFEDAGGKVTLGDYWFKGDTRPIHEKEADAILKSLESLGERLRNTRVDVKTDNMSVIGAWNSQGAKCKNLNAILKQIFGVLTLYNIDLHLAFVPSGENIADGPSRKLNATDAMLSDLAWGKIQHLYGPHSVDLMSLDSNVMKSCNGEPLRHFTPWLTPLSSGVNVFSQDLTKELNLYVFPPFGLIFPLLCLLEEQGVSRCTLVVPELKPIPVWWPKLMSYSVGSVCLGEKGEKGVMLVPSKKGFVYDSFGLSWRLLAFRVSFR